MVLLFGEMISYSAAMTYGARVREARKTSGLSQDELINKIRKLPDVDLNECNQSYLSRIERDELPTTRHKFVVHISKITGYSAEWLVFGTGVKKSSTPKNEHLTAWLIFAADFIRTEEETSVIQIESDAYIKLVQLILELGAGQPVPTTKSEINKFRNKLLNSTRR